MTTARKNQRVSFLKNDLKLHISILDPLLSFISLKILPSSPCLPQREELGGLGHEPLGEGRERTANPEELRPRRGLAQTLSISEKTHHSNRFPIQFLDRNSQML